MNLLKLVTQLWGLMWYLSEDWVSFLHIKNYAAGKQKNYTSTILIVKVNFTLFYNQYSLKL